MTDPNVPLDATAMQAEAIVEAAIMWRWSLDNNPAMTAAEWKLFAATNAYGDKYKGLRGR